MYNYQNMNLTEMNSIKNYNMQEYQDRNQALWRAANEETVIDAAQQGIAVDNHNTGMVLGECASIENQCSRIENQCHEIVNRIGSIIDRKDKKALVGIGLAFLNNVTNVIKYYSDSEQATEPMMYGFGAGFKVYNLVIGDKKEFFVITTLRPECIIIGKIKKRRGCDLYKYFMEAGVRFSDSMSEKYIFKCLEKYFSPLIAECTTDLNMDVLAGWNSSYIYIDASRSLYRGNRLDGIEIPSQKKMLASAIEVDQFENYFSTINRCIDRRVRCELVLFPMISILSSLFRKELGEIFDVALNLVLVENIDYSILEDYLKVLDRKNKGIKSINVNDKVLRGWLKEYKDETLLVNAVSNEYEEPYVRSKKRRMAYEIANLVTGKIAKDGILSEEINCNAVILSNECILGSNIAHIYLDNTSFVVAEYFDKDLIGGVMTSFIYFLEQRMDHVRAIIRKNRGVQGRKRIIAITLELLHMYFDSQGYNLTKEIGMPRKIDEIELFVTGNDINEEEIDEEFLYVMRSAKDEFSYKKVGRGVELCENEILVDESYYYISTDIFQKVLRKNGLSSCSTKILYMLKERGLLETGNERGLAIKKQTKRGREFFYRIKKEAFDEVGVLPLDVNTIEKEND